MAEAAEYLRCCLGRIYNSEAGGRLKGRKDGGRLLFTREDLKRACRGRAMRDRPPNI